MLLIFVRGKWNIPNRTGQKKTKIYKIRNLQIANYLEHNPQYS